MKYIAQKAIFEIGSSRAKWVDDKEFDSIQEAENYARLTYGTYTEPSEELPMGYFGVDDKKVANWSGRIIIKEN